MHWDEFDNYPKIIYTTIFGSARQTYRKYNYLWWATTKPHIPSMSHSKCTLPNKTERMDVCLVKWRLNRFLPFGYSKYQRNNIECFAMIWTGVQLLDWTRLDWTELGFPINSKDFEWKQNAHTKTTDKNHLRSPISSAHRENRLKNRYIANGEWNWDVNQNMIKWSENQIVWIERWFFSCYLKMWATLFSCSDTLIKQHTNPNICESIMFILRFVTCVEFEDSWSISKMFNLYSTYDPSLIWNSALKCSWIEFVFSFFFKKKLKMICNQEWNSVFKTALT